MSQNTKNIRKTCSKWVRGILKKFDTWAASRTIAQSRLPQVAAVIPTFGYLILWSDIFRKVSKSSSLGTDFSAWRLYLIWWGALLLLFGYIFYVAKCPRPIKRAPSAEDYLLLQFNLPDGYRLSRKKDEVAKFLKQYETEDSNAILIGSLSKHALKRAAIDPLKDQTRADLLRFEWENENIAHPISRRLSLVLMASGAILFLLPSVDVARRVFVRTLLLLIGGDP